MQAVYLWSLGDMQFNGTNETAGTKIHHPGKVEGGRNSQVHTVTEIIAMWLQ